MRGQTSAREDRPTEPVSAGGTSKNVSMRRSSPASRTTVVELKGRTGNLLFQYAAGLTVQQARGGRLALLAWRTPSRPQLEELLDVVDLNGSGNVFRGPRFIEWRRLLGRRVWRGLLQARKRILPRIVTARGAGVAIGETHFRPAPVDMAALQAPLIYVDSYCQHPTWFEPVLDVVTQRIWDKISPRIADLVPLEATVISLRAGDYLSNGWDLDLDYYDRAIDLLGPLTGPIWVMSDDAGAVGKLAPILARHGWDVQPLPDVGTSAETRDFALPIIARNVIMSNSTFCWWGTVTGQLQGNQPPKRIFTPARWFPGEPESDVLLRPDWIRVDMSFGYEVRGSKFKPLKRDTFESSLEFLRKSAQGA